MFGFDFSADAVKGALTSATVWLSGALLILPDVLSDPDVQAAINSLIGADIGAVLVTKLLAVALLVNRFRTKVALADKLA